MVPAIFFSPPWVVAPKGTCKVMPGVSGEYKKQYRRKAELRQIGSFSFRR